MNSEPSPSLNPPPGAGTPPAAPEDPDELTGCGGLWIDLGTTAGMLVSTFFITLLAAFWMFTDSSCWPGNTSITCNQRAGNILVYGLAAGGCGLTAILTGIAAWCSRGHRRFWIGCGYTVQACTLGFIYLVFTMGRS